MEDLRPHCAPRDGIWYMYSLVIIVTRLLCLPQPQMYPLVAQNQYTGVNKTYKQFIYYMLCGLTIFLFHFFFGGGGGPGELYV